MYINDYSLLQGEFKPVPLKDLPLDHPLNLMYEDLDLMQVLALLEIPADVAGRFYHGLRNIWFDKAIVEPRFYVVKMIDGNGNIVGVFYEDEWRKNRVYLSNTILQLQPKGKLFYLTHEIVHYMDFHGNGSVTKTEHETDIIAKNLLKSWGLV